MSFISSSDLHLTEKCPSNRKESNWMQLCLNKFRQLLEEALMRDCPIMLAGDIFDKSCHSPELVHAVMELLESYETTTVHILPGNHDLKSHSLELMGKSSIWSLSFLPNVDVFQEFTSITNGGNKLDFFPFGSELEFKGGDIAIIHEFCWKEKPNWGDSKAADAGNYKSIIKKMKGYKLIIAGDNHEHFIAKTKSCTLLNNGAMMRRRINEVDYKPVSHYVDNDLNIETIPFKIEEDVFNFDAVKLIQKKNKAIEEVAMQMGKNIKFKLDFEENMRKYLKKNKIDESICKIINEAMEDE